MTDPCFCTANASWAMSQRCARTGNTGTAAGRYRSESRHNADCVPMRRNAAQGSLFLFRCSNIDGERASRRLRNTALLRSTRCTPARSSSSALLAPLAAHRQHLVRRDRDLHEWHCKGQACNILLRRRSDLLSPCRLPMQHLQFRAIARQHDRHADGQKLRLRSRPLAISLHMTASCRPSCSCKGSVTGTA